MPNSNVSRTTPETQELLHWAAPRGVLGELTAASWERAASRESGEDSPGAETAESLELSLMGPAVSIIAEVKRMSPSRGPINPDLDSGAQARAYADGGASAISVLTEPTRFGGSIEDVRRVRSSCSLPILRKDFHVAESQLLDARQVGASAALVIVRAIEPSRLAPLARFALSIGLELLFEVRDEAELARALAAGGRIIGVNNRNLETLEIDTKTVERIVPLVPGNCVAIAESGYSTREQVEVAARAGADAVLIGSSLSASADPAQAVRELAGVPKISRG